MVPFLSYVRDHALERMSPLTSLHDPRLHEEPFWSVNRADVLNLQEPHHVSSLPTHNELLLTN